jgi:hypothetical protein
LALACPHGVSYVRFPTFVSYALGKRLFPFLTSSFARLRLALWATGQEVGKAVGQEARGEARRTQGQFSEGPCETLGGPWSLRSIFRRHWPGNRRDMDITGPADRHDRPRHWQGSARPRS